MPERQKYEVTFVVRNRLGEVSHKWTATWWCRDFAHAEQVAIRQLMENNDRESKIERIELW